MNTCREDLQKNNRNPFYLMFESIGVVYGDIGTSVLYAFKEALKTMNHTSLVGRVEIIGLVSLMIWIDPYYNCNNKICVIIIKS